jgi:hypothetical protein
MGGFPYKPRGIFLMVFSGWFAIFLSMNLFGTGSG